MRLNKHQRAALYAMFSGRCAYCGEPLGDRWHADHVEAVERKLERTVNGGLRCTSAAWKPENDHIGNLMPACPPCNIDKHNLSLEGWRRKLQSACDVLQRNQPTYRHAVRFGLLTVTAAPVIFHFERQAAHAGERKEPAA